MDNKYCHPPHSSIPIKTLGFWKKICDGEGERDIMKVSIEEAESLANLDPSVLMKNCPLTCWLNKFSLMYK